MSTDEREDLYSNNDEFIERLKEYEDAVNSGQPVFLDANELAEIADYYFTHEREKDAENALQLALSLSPGAIGPLTYRIHEALEKEDIEAAKNYYSQIVETDSPDYVYDWAEILLAQNKHEEAEEYLREEIKKIPLSERQDYIIDIAHIYEQWGYYDLAMKWILGAQKEDTLDFKEIMAHTLFGLGKYKDSEKIFNELLDKDPYSTHYWVALSNSQLLNEDYSSAIESSEFALAINPKDPEALLAKANGLFHLGNYEEALKFYHRLLDAMPDNCIGMLYAGICLVNMNRAQEAIDMLLKAQSMANDSYESLLPDIYHELAFAYCGNHQPDNALKCMDDLEKLGEDKNQLLLIKGHILLSSQRMQEAEIVFRQALESSTDTPGTLLRIVASFMENRLLKAAYELLKKYFQIVPEDTKEGYAYLAMCYYEQKNIEAFLENLKKACELNPTECKTVFCHLLPAEIAPEDYYTYIKDKLV